MSMIERILKVVGLVLIGCLVCAMVWWNSMPAVTASQREAFLRERLELVEAKLVECERLRSMTAEIPGRVSDLLDDIDRAIGRRTP
jgi:hypothetical protein